MGTTQAESLCRQIGACGGTNLTKEQFLNLVPALLCQVSNISSLGFLCDPTDGFPVFLRYTFDPVHETIEALAFKADGTAYTGDLALLDACSGGGPGPSGLDEIIPEELVAMAFGDISGAYAVGMASAHAKKYISIWNTTNEPILISKDGIVDFQIIGANQNLKIDAASDQSKWSDDIFVKYLGSGATIGTVYIAAFY